MNAHPPAPTPPAPGLSTPTPAPGATEDAPFSKNLCQRASTLLFSLNHETLGRSLAQKAGYEYGACELRRFPDGETYVRLLGDPRQKRVVVLCTLDRPDEKFLPLYFICQTARELGAAEIGLLCPYLAYMRQDGRFKEGEGITSSYFARLLSGFADWLITVDPHLHRHTSLSRIYSIPTRTLHAAPLLARWIAGHIADPLLIGPDSESRQWVASIASALHCPFVVLEKKRRGDRDVKIELPDLRSWHARTPVLVDDILSTGQTMKEALRKLRSAGLKAPFCVAVHAIFADQAYRELLEAGAAGIATCNTVSHLSNAIDITELLLTGLSGEGLSF